MAIDASFYWMVSLPLAALTTLLLGYFGYYKAKTLQVEHIIFNFILIFLLFPLGVIFSLYLLVKHKKNQYPGTVDKYYHR